MKGYSIRYEIIRNGDTLFKKYEADIYKLRYKVFKEVLNWKVDTVDGDKEIDYFDSLDDLHYVITIEDDGTLVGCMRLLPTINDYMLEKVFPNLMDNQNIPKEEKVWELSRFAIDPSYQKQANMLAFNKATLLLIKGICEFSKTRNIDSYVAVTTDRMSRMVKKLKMDSQMLGRKLQMSDCNVVTVQVNMNNDSFSAIEEALTK